MTERWRRFRALIRSGRLNREPGEEMRSRLNDLRADAVTSRMRICHSRLIERCGF
jgi:hypothetical protein